MRAKDVPLTRETVLAWLTEYNGQIRRTKKLETFLTSKLKAISLDTALIDTSEHDGQERDETSLVEMILQDLPSYGL